MIILTRDDFRGRFSITFPSINGAGDVVEGEIDVIELEELTKLFGITLATQFKADPLNAVYLPLYTPLLEGKLYSEGLKQVILSLVYLRYQRGDYSMSTENGRVLKISSTSSVINPYVQDIQMLTKLVDGWKALQIYSRANYSDFEGLDKKYQVY